MALVGCAIGHHGHSEQWQDGHGRQVENLSAGSAVQTNVMVQVANKSLHWIEHHRHGCSVSGVQLSEFSRYVTNMVKSIAPLENNVNGGTNASNI